MICPLPSLANLFDVCALLSSYHSVCGAGEPRSGELGEWCAFCLCCRPRDY